MKRSGSVGEPVCPTNPGGSEQIEFARLRTGLAEVLQGYQEIGHCLREFLESCRKWFLAYPLPQAYGGGGNPPASAPLNPPSAVQKKVPDSLASEQIQILRSQMAELADALSQLHQFRAEWTSWLTEIVCAIKDSAASGPGISVEARMLEELSRLQKERAALQAQCNHLEALLAEKTNQAAQLAEYLEQQKRHMAQQQEQWVKHLQLLKPLVDSLFTYLAQFPSAGGANIPFPYASSEALAEPTDHILPLSPQRDRKMSTG